ncbi:small heat shock protein, partial [Boletus edulis]
LVSIYYDPLTEFDRLFDDALATRFQSSLSADNRRNDSFPARHETTIGIHQDHLTVAGEARRSCSREEGRCAVRGRSYGKFSRTLKLPFATKAKLKNGVLTVTFPKTNSEQQVQRIGIQ